MGQQTKIEWCDDTVNPTMGCDGCELWSAANKSCYAGVLHERYGGKNSGFAPTFEQVTLFPGRMAKAARASDMTCTDRAHKPWLNGMPRTIFVSDMSDALSAVVPFEFLETEIIDNVTSDHGRRHIWMWLTKRSPRMAAFCNWLLAKGIQWPANLWPGTSITNLPTMTRADSLRGVNATTRFLSIEPLIEDIGKLNLSGIHLVIVGGESGPGARPFDIQWARDIRDQCKTAGVACFIKQLGANPSATIYEISGGEDDDRDNIDRLPLSDKKGGDWSEWPADLRVREFPHQPKASTT